MLAGSTASPPRSATGCKPFSTTPTVEIASNAQPASKDIETYRPALDVIWEAFGPERLIYGSNWPCTKRSGDYGSFIDMVATYFTEKGDDARERYFWKKADEAYRLGLE